ncbi:MAG: response regulator transcription factor [Campylobacterales bacterium]|nr:response regulator transcription factor [Campylobacterales bacterium]
MSIKILLLEDDPLFGETVVDLLEEEGYEVEHFTNGQDALNATFATKYDLYLLDISVPLIKGTTLLGELRDSNDDTPAIFLTSHTDKETLTLGFKNGADDYMSKPFDMDELLFRLKALLRRSNKQDIESVGKLLHEPFYKRVSYDGVELDISKKEYELLVLLMKHVNAPVTKEYILDELWSHSSGGSDGAIRVYINRLKQLLPEIQIENIRGIGYKLVS